MVKLGLDMLGFRIRLAELGGLFKAREPEIEESPETKLEKRIQKVNEYYRNLFARWEGDLDKAREEFIRKKGET